MWGSGGRWSLGLMIGRIPQSLFSDSSPFRGALTAHTHASPERGGQLVKKVLTSCELVTKTRTTFSFVRVFVTSSISKCVFVRTTGFLFESCFKERWTVIFDT